MVDALTKASGVSVDTCSGASVVGAGCGALPAVTASLGPTEFWLRIISGGVFPRPAISRTAWVTVGNCGQDVMNAELQKSFTIDCKLARLAPPPAQAAPVPHSHRPATAPEMREMVECLIQVRMTDLPAGRRTGSVPGRWR